MYEYGNARIAALRGRLLGPGVLRQLAESESPAALLEHLARLDDWQPFVAAPFARANSPAAGAGGTDPAGAVLAAIERHRFARLGALPRWYEPPARALVEALVLPLDCERAVALLRLRVADVQPAAALERVGAGAALDARQVAEIARAPTLAASVRRLGEAGLIDVRAAQRLATLCDRGEAWATVEAGLAEACFQARRARAAGGERRRSAGARDPRGRARGSARGVRGAVRAGHRGGGIPGAPCDAGPARPARAAVPARPARGRCRGGLRRGGGGPGDPAARDPRPRRRAVDS